MSKHNDVLDVQVDDRIKTKRHDREKQNILLFIIRLFSSLSCRNDMV